MITFANALFPNGSKRVRYNTRGRIALVEGTEESARMALTHFENQLEVYKVGEDEGIATAKGNIAIATKVAGIMRRC